MKGIYLTEQAKQEIEAKIIELGKQLELVGNLFEEVVHDPIEIKVSINLFEEILSSATILPVYSSWDNVERFPPDNESQSLKTLELKNGVIIQPKQ